MTQRLKRWESPRREGRNDKGKGGSARQRQRRKQFQALRQKLKGQSDNQNQPRGGNDASPFFCRLAVLWSDGRSLQTLSQQTLCFSHEAGTSVGIAHRLKLVQGCELMHHDRCGLTPSQDLGSREF